MLYIIAFKYVNLFVSYGRWEGSVRLQYWWKFPNQASQITKQTDWQIDRNCICLTSFKKQTKNKVLLIIITTSITVTVTALTNFSKTCIRQKNNETREHTTPEGTGKPKGDESKQSICLPYLYNFTNALQVSQLPRRRELQQHEAAHGVSHLAQIEWMKEESTEKGTAGQGTKTGFY